MPLKSIAIFSSCLAFTALTLASFNSCSFEKPSIKSPANYRLPDPLGDLISKNKIDTLFYIIDSLSGDITQNYKKGDTLKIVTFDSTGHIISIRINTIFPPRIRYYYDENGFVCYKSYSTDYMRDWHVATFIDSAKRIGYQKWFDQISSDPTSIFWFNENGLPDSLLTCIYDQSSCGARFKQLFTYSQNQLLKTTQRLIKEDESKAKDCFVKQLEETEYSYKNDQLTLIKKTTLYNKEIKENEEEKIVNSKDCFSILETKRNNMSFRLKSIPK